jgi:hypothetical protein
MKNITLFLLILSGCLFFSSCKNDTDSTPFELLTGPVWASDSLLANKEDASGPGGMLEIFKGEAKFNADGTGNFGVNSGDWRFAFNETEIIITTSSLPLPITTKIVELTKASLKVTTTYPNLLGVPINIRMTFKAK